LQVLQLVALKTKCTGTIIRFKCKPGDSQSKNAG
jgi:hypothetical protein